MWRIVLYLGCVILTYSSGDAYKHTVPKACLNCLCQQLTGCNPERGCVNMTCGMYALTQPFWLDAGSPKVRSPAKLFPTSSSFEACASDEECATTAVQRYMRRYERDCNRDGVVDCTDYAAIHMHGPGGCYQHPNSVFVQSVQECLQNNSDSTISPIDWRINEV